jgi:hypothetical protein
MMRLLFALLVACAPQIEAPHCPVPETPSEPWIEGCQIASECGFFEPKFSWVCESCVKFWINIRTRERGDTSTLDKAQIGVTVMRAMECADIKAEVDAMDLTACVEYHIANGADSL